MLSITGVHLPKRTPPLDTCLTIEENNTVAIKNNINSNSTIHK